ncbi:MAG: adenylyl-sulfate kinase [Planctomycetia bacterium]|nr:adenylyl-sulfate kinase [Planctomycetia bacterium]
MTNESGGVHWHGSSVGRAERESLHGHRGCLVWLTGLSGSGKSTIANLVEERLHRLGVHSFVLDGDNVRHGLNATPTMLRERHGAEFADRFGLGFSAMDREENIRRIGAVAELFVAAGLVTITAFVSPYRRDRQAVRERLAPGDFIEVLVDAPLAVCEARDPKGLYKQARAGKITGMTGIDDPYEAPEHPELTLDSASHNAAALADQVVAYLAQRGVIQP